MRAHLAGIAALIPNGIHVYDTEAERPDYNPADWSGAWSDAQRAAWTLPDRYVVLAAPTFADDSLTIDGARRVVDDYLQVMAVGISARQVRWVQEAVRSALDPGTPTVAGHRCRIKLRATGIHAVDRDVTPHRHYATDTYRYRAVPI